MQNHFIQDAAISVPPSVMPGRYRQLSERVKTCRIIDAKGEVFLLKVLSSFSFVSASFHTLHKFPLHKTNQEELHSLALPAF